MAAPQLTTLYRPILDENPITLQILGICSALAVTKTLATALQTAGLVENDDATAAGYPVVAVMKCRKTSTSLRCLP